MIRSATPLFALADRLRGDRPRPGVDRWIAAGVPQQNRAESVVWALLVAGMTGAATAWWLQERGGGPVAVALLVLPLAFAALHAVFLAHALIGSMLRLGRRGQLRLWIGSYSAMAAWFAACPGWISLAGRVWLIWMFINAAAWIIDGGWRLLTAKAR